MNMEAGTAMMTVPVFETTYISKNDTLLVHFA